MESLPADIQRKVALDSEPSELFRLCSDETFRINICDSRDFWNLKLEKDYPDMFRYYQRHNMVISNPKNTYIRKFSKYSEAVEAFVNNYYPIDERNEKYKIIYKLFRELTNLPVTYQGRSPILNYIPLLRTSRLNSDLLGSELERLLTPFVKEEQKYKY